ncbi:MAG: PilZ domain-containing protein [Deltaproteobacteria bacterium]|nr:PilZ domain-containing protein [Deltaproteobacteria bacterium]
MTGRKSRKNARVDCAISGRVLGSRGYHKGTVHNLSTGGLFFAGRNLAVGARTELEFRLEGTEIHATCEVLYRQSVGDGAGIGVRFLRINAAAVERIRKYLAAGAPSDA